MRVRYERAASSGRVNHRLSDGSTGRTPPTMSEMIHFLNVICADVIMYAIVTRGALAVSKSLTLIANRRRAG